MNLKELKQYDGKFGLMIWDKPSRLKQIHGKIKCIDDEKDEIIFKSTLGRVFNLRTKEIVSFEAKEALPEITEIHGRKIQWEGGVLIYGDSKREYDSKR